MNDTLSVILFTDMYVHTYGKQYDMVYAQFAHTNTDHGLKTGKAKELLHDLYFLFDENKSTGIILNMYSYLFYKNF